MPGTNYFLSQVAAQTPGPLLGAIVPPRLSPPPCIDLVTSARIEPYVSVIGSKAHTYHDLGSITPNHISGYCNGTPKQRYNHSYSPSPPPSIPSSLPSSLPPSLQSSLPPSLQSSLPPSLPPSLPSSLPSAQSPLGKTQLPPIPPGLGTTHLPIVRKTPQENPVGELQELCTKMRWIFPTYYISCDEAQPHERAFSVTVRLYIFREKAEAKSKRAAKREAARRILNRLRSWPTDPSLQFNGQYGASPNSMITSLELSPFEPVKATHSPPPSYYVNELSMLGQKHAFTCVYETLADRSETGELQVMARVSSFPVIVSIGKGRSPFLAKADAARKALDGLRILYFREQQPRM